MKHTFTTSTSMAQNLDLLANVAHHIGNLNSVQDRLLLALYLKRKLFFAPPPWFIPAIHANARKQLTLIIGAMLYKIDQHCTHVYYDLSLLAETAERLLFSYSKSLEEYTCTTTLISRIFHLY
jgi:hypothetical protein